MTEGKAETILLLGANGMLGHALRQALTKFTVIAPSHREVDITNRGSLQDAITLYRPNWVINAAAYTNVDGAETNRDIALAINGEALAVLVEVLKQFPDIGLMHFSTDYVFSGHQASGYVETDQPTQPVNWYGYTKWVGEQHVIQANLDRWYIIRTAWLYGLFGKNFVDTMLKLGKSQQSLRVVDDQHGSPTYTVDLAEAVADMLRSLPTNGVYHLTNAGDCTWYQFAHKIFQLHGDAVNLSACTSAAFPRPAKRPTYSILRNTKLPLLPPWEDALIRYLATVKL